MISRRLLIGLISALALLALLGSGLEGGSRAAARAQAGASHDTARAQTALGSAFTYQGMLTERGSPADGEYDFQFQLYDVATEGGQIGAAVTVEDQTVSEGVFTVELDFGTDVFTGDARWLQVGVRPGDSEEGYTSLSPRQELRPTPYALALPGLRTQQTITSPNVIGGHIGNSVTAGVVGATIAGGGESEDANRVTDNYGTVGGGTMNVAGDDGPDLDDARWATVGGGVRNTASGHRSFVGGGSRNRAEGSYASVVGGTTNTAAQAGAVVGGGADNVANGSYAVVAGGYGNTSGDYATVPGGHYNAADAYASFAAGRGAKARHTGAFVWSDWSEADSFASTAANQFLIRADRGVGMGTNAPLAQLHVQDSRSGVAVAENHVAIVENTSDGSSSDVLFLKVGNTTEPGSGQNFITFRADTQDVGSVEGDGSGGVTYKSGSADFAEWLPRSPDEEDPEPGDVVGVFGGSVSRETRGADRLLVVSTAPIVSGSYPGEGRESQYIQVALLGQVPVNVRGAVRAGDYVLPSREEDGTGVAVAPEEMTAAQVGRIVGRALESSEGDTARQVKVLVGLPQEQIVAALLRQRDARLADLETEIERLDEENAALAARLEALERAVGELDATPAVADE